jgi:hypothetical protein
MSNIESKTLINLSNKLNQNKNPESEIISDILLTLANKDLQSLIVVQMLLEKTNEELSNLVDN